MHNQFDLDPILKQVSSFFILYAKDFPYNDHLLEGSISHLNVLTQKKEKKKNKEYLHRTEYA